MASTTEEFKSQLNEAKNETRKVRTKLEMVRKELKLEGDRISVLTKAYKVLVGKVEEQFDAGVDFACQGIKTRFFNLNLSVLNRSLDHEPGFPA